MTTSATGRKLTDACNGVTTSFGCPSFLTNGDLKVYLLNDPGDANASGTLLSEGTDYTIGGGLSAKGLATITMAVAYPAGKYLRRWRQTSRAQNVEIVANQGLPAATQEASLDRLSLIDEEQDDDVGRTLRSLPGDTIGPVPAKSARIGKYAAYDANGDPVASAGTGNDSALRTDFAGGDGALLQVKGLGPNPVGRTLKSKLADWIAAEDYGVLPDGNDYTVELQALINYAASNSRRLVLPTGVKHGALTLPTNTRLVPPGSKTTVVPVAGNYDLYSISGSDVTVEGLYIDDTAKTGGYDFNISCGTSTIERLMLRSIVSFYARGGIKDSGSSGYHITSTLDDVKFRQLQGIGFNLTRSFGFIYLLRATADYANQANSDFTGFLLDSSALGGAAGGIWLTDCQVLGTAGDHNNLNQVGFDIRHASDVKALRCQADTVAGDGLRATSCNKLGLTEFELSNVGGHGVVLDTVTNSLIEKLGAYGRRGLTWNQANMDGLRLVGGCGNLDVDGGIMRDFTGHGIDRVAAQPGVIVLTGVQSCSNTGRGIKTAAGAAALMHMHGGALVGNVAGNYDLGNVLDRLTNVISDAGNLLNLTGPAAG